MFCANSRAKIIPVMLIERKIKKTRLSKEYISSHLSSDSHCETYFVSPIGNPRVPKVVIRLFKFVNCEIIPIPVGPRIMAESLFLKSAVMMLENETIEILLKLLINFLISNSPST